MELDSAILSYGLTAIASGSGGFLAAGYLARPAREELARRVEVAEHSLYTQGLAISELTEALRRLMEELETEAPYRIANEAMLTARAILDNR